MHAALQELAERLLAEAPEAPVQVRLLREVLKVGGHDARLATARQRLEGSPHVKLLAREQQPDGSWGAFHSRRTAARQRTPTTEAGVERALALGLEQTYPILQRARDYIIEVLNGKRAFPDYEEKNDRWPTGKRLFLSSTLALIEPEHPILNPERALWLEIARRTFQDGAYSAEAERQAHAELTGATVKGSYLTLRNKYSLNLLGSVPRLLPEEIVKPLLSWLWDHPEGLGYFSVPLSQPPRAGNPGKLDRWLGSLEWLATRFPEFQPMAAPAFNWLWEQQMTEGNWDLGPQAPGSVYLPLSADWRRPARRRQDWTARTLALLSPNPLQSTLPPAAEQ